MSIPTLLVVPKTEVGKKAFAFEHAMAHRQVLSVMAPLSQWSGIPYFIDPTHWDARPADMWNLNHQKAHNDFNHQLPPYFAAAVNTRGIPTHQILIDTGIGHKESLPWWTFANHREHHTANLAILPYPGALATVPWWSLPPYRATVFW
jgi:hypothetical protein